MIFISIIFFNNFLLYFFFSLYLSDGNILIIHETDIDIYDHLFKKKIRNVINFSQEDKLVGNDLAKITTSIDEEYIFSIIKNKIYIFDDKGNLLYYEKKISMLEYKFEPKYYSLVHVKEENNKSYILYVQYLHEGFLFIYVYNYDISSHEINLIRKDNSKTLIYSKIINGTIYANSYYYDKKNAISCQNIKDKNKNNINYIVCFLIIKNELALTVDIYEKNNYLQRNDYPPKFYNISDIEIIQSASAPNDSQIIVTVYDISGSTQTLIINLDDINNIKVNLVSYGFKDNFCNINYTNIFYFRDDQKFITSCLDTNGNLLMEIYNKDLYCENRKK